MAFAMSRGTGRMMAFLSTVIFVAFRQFMAFAMSSGFGRMMAFLSTGNFCYFPVIYSVCSVVSSRGFLGKRWERDRDGDNRIR